jgi:hypothetical protein
MASKKVRFAVEFKDGTRPEVDGYLVAPGLGVHRALAPDGTVLDGMWNVVHLDSGRRVCGSFATRKAAIQAGEEFAALADWTKPDGSGEFRGIVAKVYAIRNRILAESAGLIVGAVPAATTQSLSETSAAPQNARDMQSGRKPDEAAGPLPKTVVGFF